MNEPKVVAWEERFADVRGASSITPAVPEALSSAPL